MHAIEIDNFSKQYGKVTAVSSLSFTVPQGQIIGMLGPNGAGKTTTMGALLGALLPTSGAVRVLGTDMVRDRFRALPFMNFSSPYVELPYRLTVIENLTIYGKLYNVVGLKNRIHELAEDLNFTHLLNRRAGKLSAGQKTRIALAKALLNTPKVLLLDEPTASLDPDSADRIRSFIANYRKKSGATIVLASHNMAEVEQLCDSVLMMKSGRLVDQGTPQALVERYGEENLEKVFLSIAREEEVEADHEK
jgi:ABC-2 type transport system ATP-binding protein